MAEPRPAGQPRHRLRVLAAAVLAMAAAACSTVVPRTAPPSSVPVATPAPPPARPSAPLTGALPEDQQRHRIALLVPTTGANAAVGQSIANAANLALLDVGTARLRMTVYDTGGIGGAAAAASRALAEGNRLFLGPLLADDVRAVAPVASSAGVPVVSFSNDSSAASRGVYLLGFSPEDSVRRVVSYAGGRGLRRFAGLVPSGVYGRRASNALLRSAEAAGGTVTAMEVYDRTPAALATAVRKLGAAGSYDAVLISDSGRMVLQAVPLIRRDGGAGARLLGTELWNTDPALAASPVASGAWFASVSDSLYRQFATKYRTRFGRSPYRLASLGYDAVLLAARAASNWPMGSAFPAGLLTDRDGFSGVDGAFRFARDGTAERALEVKQLGGGAVTTVSPAPAGFGS